MAPPSPPRSDPPPRNRALFGGRPHRPQKGDTQVRRKKLYELLVDPGRVKKWLMSTMSSGESKKIVIEDEAVVAFCAVIETMVKKMMEAWKRHRDTCHSDEHRQLTKERDMLFSGTGITVDNLYAALLADDDFNELIRRHRIVFQNFPAAGSELPVGHRMRMRRQQAAVRSGKAANRVQRTTTHALYLAL